MLERFVHQVRVIRIPTDPDGERDALAAWREILGSRETRRMSTLGLVLTAALREHNFEDDPALIYTTTFSETRALERFIDGFPTPSPLLFQTSIHPGGAEQAMIARQQPVTEFFPIAGKRNVITQGLKTAMISSRPRAVWMGGEERGSWLLDVDTASPETFGWALSLSRDPRGALARATWDPDAPAENQAPSPSILQFLEALERREDLCWGGSEWGTFEWNWV